MITYQLGSDDGKSPGLTSGSDFKVEDFRIIFKHKF